MLTSRERWLAGLFAYHRQAGKDLEYQKRMDSSWRIRDTSTVTYLGNPSQVKIPTLAQIIERNGPFDPELAILGVDTNQNPFVIDLRDPGLGSILILGDPDCGKTRLLRSILFSSSTLNRNNEVIFNIIACKPDEYSELELATNCYGILSTRTSAATQLIHLLVELAGQNQMDGHPDSIILLAIDDLVNFIYGLDEDAYQAFRWLVRHGPQYQIWVLGIVSVDSLNWIDAGLLHDFGYKIFGSLNSIVQQYTDYTGEYDQKPETADLPNFYDLPEVIPGYQFNILVDDCWTTMWVCNPY